MITQYQPHLLSFLGKGRNFKISKDMDSFFYFSFEDALWDIIAAEKLIQGSIFLLPSFYCSAVVEKIKNKGYNCKFYKLDRNLQCDTNEFIHLLNEYKPGVIFIFHPFGITSILKKDFSWTKHLKKKSIIIEDCAHLILRPDNLLFLNKKHFYIDSLRKVTPLQGSHLYTPQKALSFPFSIRKYFNFYRFTLCFVYLAWRLLLNCSLYVGSNKLYFLSERLFDIYNRRVGASKIPTRGFWLSRFLFRFIDWEKIYKLKEKLALIYQEEIKNLCLINQNFFQVTIPRVDFKNLKFFPLGVKSEKIEKFVDSLYKKGLFIEPIFAESQHGRFYKYLGLPLHSYIERGEIKKIFNLLRKFK